MRDAPLPNGPVASARIDWGNDLISAKPRCTRFNDIYFSDDGLSETEHVFIAGNDLRRRFNSAGIFTIAELGFGTGLNFLAAWRAWRETPKPSGARLHFITVEAYPVRTDDMARAHAAWPEFTELSETLRPLLPPPIAGYHHLEIQDDVCLLMLIGEVGDMLRGAEAEVDAWFLDGFSPAKNPEMWRQSVCAEIGRLSRTGTTFATFTVARTVVENLSAAGFLTRKEPGTGRKRQMLAGMFERSAERREVRAAWFQRSKPFLAKGRRRLGIIGGGIAGAALARAALRAQVEPVIIDPQGLAKGASGNVAGLIMPRLDLGSSPAADFSRTAFVHVVRLLETLGSQVFNQCGVTLASADEDDAIRLRRLFEAELLPSNWIEWTSQGLRFTRAGVVDPTAYVNALARGAPIVRKSALRIERRHDVVAIVCTDDSRLEFDAIVIANSLAASVFSNLRSVPFLGSTGQIDWFRDAPTPETAIASGPYLMPAPKGGVVIGATRKPIDLRSAAGAEFLQIVQTSAEATRSNLAALSRLDPLAANSLEDMPATSRAAIRCETPDRLPLVGPVPDWGFFGAAYDPLRFGRKIAYAQAEYQHGVFISAGLGARGLVTAPLCADMIIADLTDGPSPVSAEIAEALHPGRFFIRNLRRSQPVRGEN